MYVVLNKRDSSDPNRTFLFVKKSRVRRELDFKIQFIVSMVIGTVIIAPAVK